MDDKQFEKKLQCKKKNDECMKAYSTYYFCRKDAQKLIDKK